MSAASSRSTSPATVAPLLIHDLPVVLWWPDDVPFGSAVFNDLATESRPPAGRLGLASAATAWRGWLGMAAALADGTVVHDIAWMRLLLWRELLAGLFDHPLLNPELRSIASCGSTSPDQAASCG